MIEWISVDEDEQAKHYEKLRIGVKIHQTSTYTYAEWPVEKHSDDLIKVLDDMGFVIPRTDIIEMIDGRYKAFLKQKSYGYLALKTFRGVRVVDVDKSIQETANK